MFIIIIKIFLDLERSAFYFRSRESVIENRTTLKSRGIKNFLFVILIT